MNIHFGRAYDTQGKSLYQRRNPGMIRRRDHPRQTSFLSPKEHFALIGDQQTISPIGA